VKTLLKLLVVAVVLQAAARAGLASWRHYQFKDAIEEELIFADARVTDDVLHGRIVELASRLEVPIDGETVEVNRQGHVTRVHAVYTQQVKLVPRIFEPVWSYDASVEVRARR
jgi:hypothetical protein